MAFGDFTYPEVADGLGLIVAETDLFTGVVPLSPRAELLEALRVGARLGLSVNTEKARSEFLIAPVLVEFHRITGEAFGLFSGVELVGDASRGLIGYCDFILTRSPRVLSLTAPLITIVEAKNDNLHNGLGQCIAAMVAARLFNERHGSQAPVLFGLVTTGSAWKFLRLVDTALSIDRREYFINEVGHILAILRSIMAP